MIVSDCHLGSPQANIPKINGFLGAIECDRIVFAGDLFDLWFASPDNIRRNHAETLALIRKMGQRGVDIKYLLGNHDEDYAKKPVMSASELPVVTTVEFSIPSGKRIAVIHGHEFDRIAKKHPILYYASFWVDNLSAKLLGISSKTFRESGPLDLDDSHYSDAAQEMHADARRFFSNKAIDVIIMGHTHSPAIIPRGRFVELYDAGDWKTHDSYVDIQDDNISVKQYT